MRRRGRRLDDTPEIMLSPMIDLIFLLLVFFIISTMHMVDMKTMPVELPKAQNSVQSASSKFLVTIKKDGSIYLDKQPIELRKLMAAAVAENQRNSQFAVVVRADGDAEYRLVIKLLDELKGAGIRKFGLATDQGKEL